MVSRVPLNTNRLPSSPGSVIFTGLSPLRMLSPLNNCDLAMKFLLSCNAISRESESLP